MNIAIPTSLPWEFVAGETQAMIVEADGTTVMAVSVTANTTAHTDFYKNLGFMVHAANQLGQQQSAIGAPRIKTWKERLEGKIPESATASGAFETAMQAEATELRAALEAARTQANRQNMMAGRVMERLQGRRDQLERTLRAVRMLIDRSQPQDLPGAIMAIDSALGAAKVMPPATVEHDNLRDNIGQAIADYAAEHADRRGRAGAGIDWCSAHDIDPLADRILALIAPACQHEYAYFGDQPARRCIRCDAVEQTEAEASHG